MRVLVKCPCGKDFDVAEWEIRANRGKYCSNACKFAYRKRPSGLKYELKVENSSWIKPGQRLSPDTEFQPEQRNNPEGEFQPGTRTSPDTEFKLGQQPHNYLGGYYFRLYGITHDQWLALYDAQDGKCAICGKNPKRILDTDHDHSSGVVRGLLCGHCNKGISMFHDDVELLKSAICYLGSEV